MRLNCSAEIDCYVDLDPDQKGVHMSRFPELFEEAIDETVMGEMLLVAFALARLLHEIGKEQTEDPRKKGRKRQHDEDDPHDDVEKAIIVSH